MLPIKLDGDIEVMSMSGVVGDAQVNLVRDKVKVAYELEIRIVIVIKQERAELLL